MNQNRFYSFVIASLFALGLSAQSQAAVINFQVAQADEQFVNNGASPSPVVDTMGFPLTLSAFNINPMGNLVAGLPGSPGGVGPFPYLDGDSGGVAGLGVCQVLGDGDPVPTNQCDPTSDDNITNLEVLKLNFGNQEVLLDSIELRDGSHGTDFTGDISIIATSNAALPTLSDFENAANRFDISALNPAGVLDTNLTGTMFYFVSNATFVGNNSEITDQIYLSIADVQAIPVPSAFILFATGLGALIGGRYLTNRKS